MSVIPFLRDMDFVYGQAQQMSPRIRRAVASNPGPFTFKGTGVYIVGSGEVAVIDPGPDIPGHMDVLMRALGGDRVTHIFVTHRHADHSPAARPLAERTGAKIYASTVSAKPTDSEVRLEAGDDLRFRPDAGVRDGERFRGPNWTIEAVSTPGHAAHHMAYALLEENALFPGDHIMGWSTSVVSPPDGDMDDYLTSLEKVRDRAYATLWPTHGPPIGPQSGRDVRAFIQAYIDHRIEREAQILHQLEAGRRFIPEIVRAIYANIDAKLHPAACHSVLAHMIRLAKRGQIVVRGELGVAGEYRATTRAALPVSA